MTITDCQGGHALPPVRLVGTPGQKRMMVIVLRGAMDGLDAVQPYGDPALRSLRKDLSLGPAGGAADLDGFFALHPALKPLMPLWTAGQLAFAHAVSTPYRDKRSHFDGQEILEIGSASVAPDLTLRSGWLNRLVASLPGATERLGLASAPMTPMIARGDAPFATWSAAAKMTLQEADKTLLRNLLAPDRVLAAAFDGALIANGILSSGTSVANDADVIAKHFVAGGGVAVMGINGWDSHAGQAAIMTSRLGELASVILRVQSKLSAEIWSNLVIACVTEFGRTARQNGSGGTDHGTGSCAIFAGGAVAGGKVYGSWPGLANLYADRDLMPTSDVRSWLGSICHAHMGVPASLVTGTIFPGIGLACAPVA